MPLQTILWISLGSIVGGNLRYFVARLTAKLIPSDFPYGTLLVNVTGSLMLGFFLVWTTERVFADPRWRLLIAVGYQEPQDRQDDEQFDQCERGPPTARPSLFTMGFAAGRH